MRPTSEDESRAPKRPYAEPTLKEVELRPSEAVLGFCKGAGGGPLQASCLSPAVCYSNGS